MTEYAFGQTRASLELLEQAVDVLKAKIEEKNKMPIQNENHEENKICSDKLKDVVEKTLQKIDETTAIIDEVLK